MARVRVFLCTHRRAHLLRRALQSLLAQTVSDWVCELHNDAPGDDAPSTLLAELAPHDTRFIYCPHAHNWGAVATFNHVFIGGPEPLASLLEDDNWWEPDFLARALATLEQRPLAALVWSNMRLWTEEADNRWRDTGRTIWDVEPQGSATSEFCWPQLLQAFDAVHSQGAMVFRPGCFRTTQVPAATPLAIIEPMRERVAVGPLILMRTSLANFAHTRQSARSADAGEWLQAKLLLAASFFDTVSVADKDLERMWSVRRRMQPRDTGVFFLLAWLQRDARFVRPAELRDWFHFLLGAGRHPRRLLQGLRCRQAHPEVWSWLRRHSIPAPSSADAGTLCKDEGQRSHLRPGQSRT